MAYQLSVQCFRIHLDKRKNLLANDLCARSLVMPTPMQYQVCLRHALKRVQFLFIGGIVWSAGLHSKNRAKFGFRRFDLFLQH